MLARVWLVVPLLGGCNQLLGLDPTARATDAGTTGDDDAGIDSGNDDTCPEPGEIGFEDEDGDSLDDRCDNCPANANLEQDDADRDGVGDACDATATPSRIAFFDGFHDGDVAGWRPSGIDAWRATGDAAVLENGTGISLLMVDGLDVADGRVVAPIEIVSLPTAINRAVGVAFAGFDFNGYVCVADQRGDMTISDAILYAQTRAVTTVLDGPTPMSGSFVSGAVLTADARWSAGDQTCTVDLGGATVVSAADTAYPSGSAGIYAQGVEVRVPYVIVYEER